MNNPATLEARVSYVFKAPAEKVFTAWLDPVMVGQWMFGPAVREEEVVSIEIDPKPGGAFSFLVKRDTLVVDHIGTYIKIEQPKYLEFNWGVKGMSDNSIVRVEIIPHDSGCELILVHELNPAWHEYLQRCKDGWLSMLLALAKLLKA